MPHFLSHRLVRLFIAVVAVVGCLWVVWTASYLGLSRLLGKYAVIASDLPSAETAVQLAPSDAEAYVAKAGVLSLSPTVEESIAVLERAIALRPADYYLWLQLGLLRDRAHDSEGALAAFNEAVRLAPFYAEPMWQRGNLFLRMNRYSEAFADLSQAARSNPELVRTLLDLAWGLSKGDPAMTEQLAEVNNGKRRIAFAKFLAGKGKAVEAMAQFRAAGLVPEETKRELVEQLVTRKSYAEAFEVWKSSEESVGLNEKIPSIQDGGFESPLSFDGWGFGWIVPRRVPGVTTSLDSTQPHSGSKNLRIEFEGASNPTTSLVSQLVLVEPSKHYRINFAARSQDVVTGGLPVAFVNDVSPDRKLLGKSAQLPKGSSGWQGLSVEFTTAATTPAVILSIQRENCITSPCPIFGAISLDSFSVEEVK